jgi:lipopolysaccharide/colanic/teichoic acid biosynthesis glycosyltransferase
MHSLRRILKFPAARGGRLSAMAADAANAQRLVKAVTGAAPLAKMAAPIRAVFSPDWLVDYPHLRRYDGSDQVAGDEGDAPSVWLNGRYLLTVDDQRLLEVIRAAGTDVISISVCPALRGGRELVRLTGTDHVAGYRRLYEDAAEPAPLTEWPHLVVVSRAARLGALQEQLFNSDLGAFRQAVCRAGLSWLHFKIGGRVLDLESQHADAALEWPPATTAVETETVPASLRLRMLRPPTGVFRVRPFFSYARLGKRLFDIAASACILLILFPLLLAVALLVKLTSPGPVLYGARRQGLHGKPFDCLKFRTMMLQAEAIQYRLRVVNQVDGPQFKIENDPRVTGIGTFLRDTCIDELPQFFNVLLGQMSIVGPRPSPAGENESCPLWRDARLSVRPGITGLWQVCRTRRNSMDFQEWVYYDTRYVKKLSFGLDLSICLKTAQKLIGNFLDQFG